MQVQLLDHPPFGKRGAFSAAVDPLEQLHWGCLSSLPNPFPTFAHTPASAVTI
jgi:hypothetical protein